MPQSPGPSKWDCVPKVAAAGIYEQFTIITLKTLAMISIQVSATFLHTITDLVSVVRVTANGFV